MKTQLSFSFQAKIYTGESELDQISPFKPEFIMSAGRWHSHYEAAKAAAAWLMYQADLGPQQYCIELVQIEELELLP